MPNTPHARQSANGTIDEHHIHLRDDLSFLKTVIDQQRDTLFVFDPATGTSLLWNRAFREISGYSDAEIAALPAPASYYSPEDVERAMATIEHVIQEGTGSIELELICKDGRTIPFEYDVSAAKNEKGELEYFVSIGRDVSERKEAEETLRESEELFASFMNNLPAIAFIKDGNSTPIYVNDYMNETLGAKDWLGRPLEEILPPDMALQMKKDDQEALKDGFREIMETAPDLDGTFRTFRTRKFRIDRPGSSPLLGGISIDISELEQANKTLRKREEQYQDLYDNAPAMFASVDHETGLVIRCNKMLLARIGFSETEVIGKHILERYHPDSLEDAKKAFQSFLDSGVVSGTELQLRTKEGERVNVLLSVTSVVDEEGTILHSRSVWQDITERKRTEAALRESEEKFRIIAEQSLQGVSISNMESVLYANPVFQELFGYSIEELNALSPEERVQRTHHDDRERIADFYGKLLTGADTLTNIEYRIIRKDRTIRWIESRPSIIEYAGGQAILAVFIDITDRKKAEIALRESEEKYRSLIENIGEFDLIYSADFEGNLNYVSPSIEKKFGFTPEEFFGDSYLDNLTTDEQKKNEVILNTEYTMNRLPTPRRELQFYTRDRTKRFWMEIIESIIKDYEGNSVGVLGIARDVTDRKNVEQALRKSEERLRTIIDHSTELFYIHDTNNILTYVSPLCEQMFGYSQEEMLRNWTELATDSPINERAIGFTMRAIETGERQEPYLAELRRSDGRFFTVEVRESPIPDENGTVIGMTGMLRDVTEQIKAEEALRVSEKRFRIAGKAAYDLLYEWDVKTNSLEWFGDVDRMLGFKKGKISHDLSAWMHLIHPDDIGVMENAVEEHRVSTKAINYEYRILHSDGTYRYWNDHALPLLDANGKPYRWIGVCTDITERKQTEQIVRQEKERLDNIIDGTNAGTWEWNVQTGECRFNDRWANFLGFTLEEISPVSIETWMKFAHPEDLKRSNELLEKHFSGELDLYHFECRMKHRDGYWIWVLDRGKVTSWTEDGKPLWMFGTHQLITKQKRTELALRQSEKRFDLAMSVANDGIWDWNLVTNEVYFDPRYYTMAGYEVNEFPSSFDAFRERVHPDDFGSIEKEINEYLMGNVDIYSIEFRFKRKDEHWIWIHGQGKIVARDDNGNPVRFVGTHSDVTVQKQAKQALRESEEKFKSVFENTGEGIGIVDLDETFLFANPKAHEIFGVQVGQLEGKNLKEFVDKETFDQILERTTHYAGRTGEIAAAKYEIRISRPDGKDRFILLTTTPRIDSTGSSVGSYGIFRDITRQKQDQQQRIELERQIQHAQKLESLGVLAGGIAHDFNNLLMGMLGNADLALTELKPMSPGRESIKHIETAAMRAAELAKQMLAYSGKGKFVLEEIDVNSLIEEMTHLLEVSKSKNVVIKYNFARDLPALEADATQMRQIIMNLLTNASEAIGERSGVVSISTGVMHCDTAYLAETYLDDELTEGHYVFVEVSDTGCGMDKETILKVFDPFFTTKFTGRGLGMAAVLGIIRGHNGAIKIYSEPDRGTTIKVLFPALDHSTTTDGTIDSVEGNEWHCEGTVLIVDDEKTVLTVGKAMLEKRGIRVLTAESGSAALRLFEEHKNEVACVILDLTMPGMGGEETFTELRRISSNVRIIMSSGYNEQEVTNRFAGKGLAGFLQKPYRMQTLMDELRRVIDG